MADQLYELCMPSLGADMTEGTLVEWQVKVGDQVNKGDIVAVIETQKGAIDMEAYQPGRVIEILVQPVALVPVGTPLARLVTKGAGATAAEPTEPGPDADKTAAVPEGVSITLAPQTPNVRAGARVLASPAARKRAEALQLDLAAIAGTGPEGAVLLRDLVTQPSAQPVKTIDAEPRVAPAATDTKGAMRAAIARAMEKSKREIPHYYLTLDVDISAAQRWLQQQNADKAPDQRMLLLALVLKAVARNLVKYPALNGHYLQGQYQPSSAIHIGTVISLRDGGMQVPAIHGVDRLSLQETMAALRDISQRSRSGHLRSSELTDATITVTCMGERGADQVLGVIYPPQVALVGVGRSRPVPAVVGDQVVVREGMTLSLCADHRVSDGMLGAKFLNAVAKTLQKPESL